MKRTVALTTPESAVYEAGMNIQSGLPFRTGVLLRQLVDQTGYTLPTIHIAVKGLIRKRLAHWPMRTENRRKNGALRFWQVKS